MRGRGHQRAGHGGHGKGTHAVEGELAAQVVLRCIELQVVERVVEAGSYQEEPAGSASACGAKS